MGAMEPFREFLSAWLAARGWSINRLAEEAGISQSLLSKYLHTDPRRQVRPTDATLRKLAPIMGKSHNDLMRMVGRLDDSSDRDSRPPRPPISVQQRSIAENYERWMTVMGPRMGDQAAHDHYWDSLVRLAAQAVSTAEAVIDAVANPLESTAVSEAESGAVSDRVSGPQRPTNTPPDDPTGPLGICKTSPVVRLRELVAVN